MVLLSSALALQLIYIDTLHRSLLGNENLLVAFVVPSRPADLGLMSQTQSYGRPVTELSTLQVEIAEV